MSFNIRLMIFISIIGFMTCEHLVCGDLYHDIATGTTSGFDLEIFNWSNPSSYENSTEVWRESGYAGRLIYTGDPTTLTISSSGTAATETQNNRFYFTYLMNGTYQSYRWREFFIVARVKGLYQGSGNNQHDFSGMNSVVANNPGTIPIAHGAGNEEVQINEWGYNTQAQRAIYNGSNGYRYKYPYQYIWIDLTLIRTSSKNDLRKAFYESQLKATTTEGLSYTLRLIGKYKNPNSNSEPSPYYFGVERTIEDTFPFTLLETKTSTNNYLKVGKLRYSSEDSAATIHLASNEEGTSDMYLFVSPHGDHFPYSVVFDATLPNRSPVTMTTSTLAATELMQIYSPIDNTDSDIHVLEGDIGMYLPSSVNSLSGIYSSTIYCFITQTD